MDLRVYFSVQSEQEQQRPHGRSSFIPPNPSHVEHVRTTPSEREGETEEIQFVPHDQSIHTQYQTERETPVRR